MTSPLPTFRRLGPRRRHLEDARQPTTTFLEMPAYEPVPPAAADPEEMAKWIIALQRGKLLASPASLTMLWTPGRLNDGTIASFFVADIKAVVDNAP